MIELKFQQLPVTDVRARINMLMTFSEIMVWFTKTLNESSDLENIVFDGFISCYQDPSTFSAFLLCDIDSHNRLLEILKQPPGEFVGKYIPRIVNSEKEPEQKEDENNIPPAASAAADET